MSTTGPQPGTRVIVVGCGVIGLTTALLLARRGLKVHVVAREMPSDHLSQDWASPWAGANWCPFGSDPVVSRWETEGLKMLKELVSAGLAMHLPVTRYASTEAGLHQHWYQDVVSDYKVLSSDQCPPDSVGVSFTSVSINAPVYCEWLESQCRALGVVFERRTIDSLGDVVRHSQQVVVNATGLGAKWLIDVSDQAVEPIRGQVVLVRAPKVKTCTMDATLTSQQPTRSTYVIPRPNSGGQVICGGCYEVGSEERLASPALSSDILEKCLKHHPELSADGTVEGIEVIRHCVGFRPSRRNGPRLEVERKVKGTKQFTVVHAYGIGPAGYQASWGMARDAADLAAEGLERADDGEHSLAKL